MNSLGSWIPKLISVLIAVLTAVQVAQQGGVKDWHSLLMTALMAVFAWFARQDNKTSEDVGAPNSATPK